ncbi:MAG: hypothetical protein GX804_05605 [Lentisphaerae bacterium]|jgi:hypothetical protein|nr:hypothetical protein [Lentisphaerota bacterium]
MNEQKKITDKGVAGKSVFYILSLILLVIAAGIRVYGAWLYALDDNPDYAVVVLMVRHIVAGKGLPIFFYGQNYMGSLEPVVSSALAFIFGAKPFIVCLGTALLAFIMIVEVWRLARDVAGDFAAFIALLLTSIGPFSYFHYMASPRGGYALCLLLTVLLIRDGVFLGVRKPASVRTEVISFLKIGFVTGLAFWNFWLVAPAVGAAGLMILWRIRLRIFRPSVWLPAAGGFFLGSLPWWLWFFTRSATGDGSVGGKGFSLSTCMMVVRRLFDTRFPSLVSFGFSDTFSRITVFIVVLLIILPVTAIIYSFYHSSGRERNTSIVQRERFYPLYRLGFVSLLHFCALLIFYIFSSFGTYNTSRYLLPLIPVWAVWSGSGIGALASLWKGGDPATVSSGFLRKNIISFCCLGIAAVIFLAGSGVMSLKKHIDRTSQQRTLHEAGLALTSVPASERPVFGEFMHFGLNWSTDEKTCLVSPRLWRYHPYLLELEEAVSPGVFGNMDVFTDFLKNTSTEATIISAGRYSFIYDAVPPTFLYAPVSQSVIESIVSHDGRDITRALIDFNGESSEMLNSIDSNNKYLISIKLRSPQNVSGVKLFITPENPIVQSRVLGRNENSDDWFEVSPSCRLRNWYWSGHRFYSDGINHRTEILFADEVRVSDLRIELSGFRDGAGLCIETLQLLCKGPKREKSVDIAEVANIIKSKGVERVFADRWYANAIYKELKGEVWTSREPAITGEDLFDTIILPRTPATAVAVLECERERTQEVFASAGINYEEVAAGGMVIFLPRYYAAENVSDSILCFHGGQLMYDHHVESLSGKLPGTSAFFPDLELKLLHVALFGTSPKSATFVLEWEKLKKTIPVRDLFVFIHALDEDGKIIFQVDRSLTLNTRSLSMIGDSRWSTSYVIEASSDTPPGKYNLVFGLWSPSLLSKRFAAQSDEMKVTKKRLLLPVTLEVE